MTALAAVVCRRRRVLWAALVLLLVGAALGGPVAGRFSAADGVLLAHSRQLALLGPAPGE